VRLSVSETGDVTGAEVISGDPILAKSALEAAKQWKFRPFIRNGKPVPVTTRIPFNFAFTNDIQDVKDSQVAENSSAQGGLVAPGGAPQRIHLSQNVTQGLLVHRVTPIYPPEAKQARIQGVVVLRGVIDKEGRIADLHVISGPKELAPAAMGAVQQWRYRPYLLEGKPVEVDTEIRVNFQLRN